MIKVLIYQLLVLVCLITATPTYAELDIEVEEVSTDLTFPWSIDFLPDGSFIITEKIGNLIHLSSDGQTKTTISNTPDVLDAGQGGLLDIVLASDFAQTQQLFLSYADGNGAENYLKVISAKLVNNSLTDIKLILTTNPSKPTNHHYGARIAEMADGTLLITVGDGFQFRDKAQTLDNHFGKILRITKSGTIPEDNPFINSANALPEIFSLGHRNPQAILVNDAGEIWSNEHGPKGGDELNLIQAGQNFGWPAVTHGLDYSGAMISPYSKADSMVAPVAYWVPSIAPAGMTQYRGDKFPTWQGDFLLANLAERSIRRLIMESNQVKEQKILLQDRKERYRDVRTGPDGYIYILTDAPKGKLLRLKPTP